MKKVLFHVHTNLSIDSNLHKKKLFRFCKKNAIDIVVVSDHYAFFTTKPIVFDWGGIVLPACEFMTSAGDLIGIFFSEIKDEQVQRMLSLENLNKVATLVHEYGGITVLPHPYARHQLDQIDFEQIDIIEIHNARYDGEQARKASQLAMELNKPTIIGADAHLYCELKNTLNIKASSLSWGKEIFFKANCDEIKKHTTWGNRFFSQFLMMIRQRRLIAAAQFFSFALVSWIRRRKLY